MSHHRTYIMYHSSLNHQDHKININVIEFKGKIRLFWILRSLIVSVGYGEVIDNFGIWDPAIKYLELNLEEFFE